MQIGTRGIAPPSASDPRPWSRQSSWSARGLDGSHCFKLSARPGGLGLTCAPNGLDLAGIALLEKAAARFRPRPPDQIGKLLERAYRVPVQSDGLTGGLRAVANALNDGDIARAMIAALWLRLPPLDWDGAVRIAQAQDALQKYDPNEARDWHGRWTNGGGGSANSAASNPPPASPIDRPRHRYPSADARNPLRHLVATENDENGRGGLLGDFMDLPREFRLQAYEGLRSRLEAVEPGNPQLQSLTSPDYSPTQADIDGLSRELDAAQERAGELPATAWQLGWSARGYALELMRLRGKRILPLNARTIDDFPNDVVVSIKSIDLNAFWYRNPVVLSYQINRYVGSLAKFDGLNMRAINIERSQIRGRILDIVIPIRSGTLSQMRAIDDSIERARRLGIHILINRY